MRLQGKTAMVTGGASGFGRGIAEAFGREGANVVILDLNQAGAQEVASAISNHALAIEGDVTKKSDIERAVAQTVELFGRLDIVVNNAGWTHVNQPMLEVDEDVDELLADDTAVGALVNHVLESGSTAPKPPYSTAVKEWEELERFVESRLRRE